MLSGLPGTWPQARPDPAVRGWMFYHAAAIFQAPAWPLPRLPGCGTVHRVPGREASMHTIRTILKQKKSNEVWSVSPDDTVLEAIKRMAELGIGAVLVMDGERLEGILSERDYARKIILQGRRSAETRVAEVMSRDVITGTLEMTADQGLALMTEKFFRHLPIIEDGRVIGLVSIGDLVKKIIAEQQAVIRQLERYVTG
jgi:CBS domain-containing protein